MEGYVESIATGLDRRACTPLRWRTASRCHGYPSARRPWVRCVHYVSGADPRNYQPANITFDLLPALDDETRGSSATINRRATPRYAAARLPR